jgi:negative regulator of sigma E activity
MTDQQPVAGQPEPVDPLRHAWEQAKLWAQLAQVGAGLLVLLGVIGGVALIFMEDENSFGDAERPYVGLGIGAIVSSLAIATAIASVASYITWRLWHDIPTDDD